MERPINLFIYLSQMSKQNRSPTLREYIDSYQQLRRAKSNGNMLSAEKIPVVTKPTAEIEQQISDLLECIKRLIPKNLPSTALCISQQLYELTKLINLAFRKLKKLEGIDGSFNSRNPNFASSLVKIEHKESLPLRDSLQTDSIMNIPIVQTKEELIQPQALCRQIKFSHDFTSLNGSTATQDITPRKLNSYRRQNMEKKEKNENFFRKEIARVESIYRKQSHDNEEEEMKVNNYRIMIPEQN